MVVTAGTHKSGDISTLPNQHYGSVIAKVPGAASFSFSVGEVSKQEPTGRGLSGSSHPPGPIVFPVSFLKTMRPSISPLEGSPYTTAFRAMTSR